MSKNTFALTFRGEYVASWTSVYDEQHVVLTYKTPASTRPTVALRYKTLANCVKEAKSYSALTQWPGQSFIVRVTPGTHEITDLVAYGLNGKEA